MSSGSGEGGVLIQLGGHVGFAIYWQTDFEYSMVMVPLADTSANLDLNQAKNKGTHE